MNSNVSTKTLYTCVWNGYWERFGQKWLKQINLLNTKPNQIFVVSDKPLPDCPYEVILASSNYKPYPITDFRQKAVDYTTSDWWCGADIDDDMLPNFLDNINDEYDIHAHYPFYVSDELVKQKQWEWETMFDRNTVESRPVHGQAFIKSKYIKQFKISKYGWQDASIFYELRSRKCSVYFDQTIRFIRNKLPDGLESRPNVKTKIREDYQIFIEYKNKYKGI